MKVQDFVFLPRLSLKYTWAPLSLKYTSYRPGVHSTSQRFTLRIQSNTCALSATESCIFNVPPLLRSFLEDLKYITTRLGSAPLRRVDPPCCAWAWTVSKSSSTVDDSGPRTPSATTSFAANFCQPSVSKESSGGDASKVAPNDSSKRTPEFVAASTSS